MASELRRPEVAGGQIQQGQRRNLTRNVQSRQVVVPFRRQGGIDGSARCEHARDLAADDLFGELGILHLFANGDPVALAQQAGEVIVGGVVGHPAHRHRALFISRCECDLQFPRGDLRVFKKQLVEVAHAEKQQGVGVLPLGSRVLPHERRSGCLGRWSWGKSRHGKRQHIVNDMLAFKDKEKGCA